MADAPTSFSELVRLLLELVDTLIGLLLTVVFLYFVWKTIDAWIINVGDPTKRAAGKHYFISALIAFVVLIIAWGVVSLLSSSLFGVN